MEVIKSELKRIVFILIVLYESEKDLESLMIYLEFNQLMVSGYPKKISPLDNFFGFQNVTSYLFGKVHNIYSKKNLFEIIFSPSNLNALDFPQNFKKTFFKNFFLEGELNLNLFIKKKKRKIKLNFSFYDCTSNLKISENLIKKKQFLPKPQTFWWVVIGEETSNKVFWCKKLKNFGEKRVEIQFNSKEKISQLKVFAVNELSCDLDKEAFFSFNPPFPS